MNQDQDQDQVHQVYHALRQLDSLGKQRTPKSALPMDDDGGDGQMSNISSSSSDEIPDNARALFNVVGDVHLLEEQLLDLECMSAPLPEADQWISLSPTASIEDIALIDTQRQELLSQLEASKDLAKELASICAAAGLDYESLQRLNRIPPRPVHQTGCLQHVVPRLEDPCPSYHGSTAARRDKAVNDTLKVDAWLMTVELQSPAPDDLVNHSSGVGAEAVTARARVDSCQMESEDAMEPGLTTSWPTTDW